MPVPYPASCSPQAWASASPLLIARALLGLEPDVPNGVVVVDPLLPIGSTRLRVEGVPLAGSTVTVETDKGTVAVRGLPRGLAVLVAG
jgi:glycogen debranching enzyme